MIRSPGCERGAVGRHVGAHEQQGRRRVLRERTFGHDVTGPGHRGDHGPRVDPRDLVSEDHAAVTDVAGEDGLDVVEGDVEVHQLEGRRQPRHRTVVPDPDRHLDLDRRCAPPGQRHRGPVRRHPGVEQVPHDGFAQAEVLLDGRRVEADLPSHRHRPGRQRGVPIGQHGAHAAGDGGRGVLVSHPASLAPAACRGHKRSGRLGPAGPSPAALMGLVGGGAVAIPARFGPQTSLRRGGQGVG